MLYIACLNLVNVYWYQVGALLYRVFSCGYACRDVTIFVHGQGANVWFWDELKSPRGDVYLVLIVVARFVALLCFDQSVDGRVGQSHVPNDSRPEVS